MKTFRSIELFTVNEYYCRFKINICTLHFKLLCRTTRCGILLVMKYLCLAQMFIGGNFINKIMCGKTVRKLKINSIVLLARVESDFLEIK